MHYYVLALIPCIWLLAMRTESPRPARLAGAAVVASSGIVGLVLTFAGLPAAMPAPTAVTWIPLWAARLVMVSTNEVDDGPAKRQAE